MEFSSLYVLKFVVLMIFSATNDENFVKITKFWFSDIDWSGNACNVLDGGGLGGGVRVGIVRVDIARLGNAL